MDRGESPPLRGRAVTRAVRIAAALAFGLAAAVLLAEMAVRAAGLAPGINPLSLTSANGTFVSSPNPLLKYVPKAGSGDINAYGIRERDIDPAKPRDVFRIVVVGDSVAYGYCNNHESIAAERTFPRLLEEILNRERWAGSKRVEVINLGVSGYDTSQEAEFLREKGLAFDPDLVVVAYSLNDALDASYELAAFRRTAGWYEFDRGAFAPTLALRLFQHSHLFRLVWQRVRALSQSRQQPPGEQRVESGFDEIAAMAHRRRFGVVVAIFPMFEKFETYAREGRHRWARERAEARGFAVLDLLPAFRRASGPEWTKFQGRCNFEHPDENGHALAARTIADYLAVRPELRLR